MGSIVNVELYVFLRTGDAAVMASGMHQGSTMKASVKSVVPIKIEVFAVNDVKDDPGLEYMPEDQILTFNRNQRRT
jgi:hypothetical protein